MAVGARTGDWEDPQWLRRAAKWFLKRLASYLVESRIPDLNSGLRVFRRELALRYFHLLPSNFSFTTTITLALLSDGYRVAFLPIHYAKRVGRSKISPWRDAWSFLVLVVRTAVYFNPLKVFLPIAGVLCVWGAGVLVWRVLVYRDIAQLEVLMLLMGTQIGFMGLLADVVVRRLGSR